jgi:hypothetical protein
MNDQETRLSKARELLDKHGLQNWEIAFADLSRARSRSLTGASFGAEGICIFWSRKILIDPKLVNRPTLFLQTVKHEIAHALLGRLGHGRDWLKLAKKVGCTKRSLSIYKNFQI